MLRSCEASKRTAVAVMNGLHPATRLSGPGGPPPPPSELADGSHSRPGGYLAVPRGCLLRCDGEATDPARARITGPSSSPSWDRRSRLARRRWQPRS
jgi:hypothetical protein